MADTRIVVKGISELRRALKEVGDMERLSTFRDGLKAAADIVAQDARKRVPTRSGQARDSIRATAGGNRAYVRGGKATVPYFGWLDFGSRSPVTGNPRSVGPWARSGAGPRGGRFLYPAWADKREEAIAAVENAVDDVIRKVGL